MLNVFLHASHEAHGLWEVVTDALLDTLKLLPFLFLSYLLMEFLEHKSGDASKTWLRRSGKIGPVIGGALGILPQCGFSAAASGLYTGRMITTGTLLAVYLSTSDEMLPILISEGAPFSFILKILGTKLLIGIAAGVTVDLVAAAIRRRRSSPAPEPQIEELCEREGCQCSERFWVSALRHTLRISLFLLLFSLVLGAVIFAVGEEHLAELILDRPILSNFLAAVVGLIPNCVSSVLLTKLHLDGILSVGAMLSGLLVNAGVALALLFRNNRPLKDSFRILLLLFSIGLLCGILIDVTPLAGWLRL
ncbi:MAG: arsenic efflux protein [Clostridia bacterium]|nr:arsenic efflux protein [Clostridia bacterium]